jgi:hypothetical protein
MRNPTVPTLAVAAILVAILSLPALAADTSSPVDESFEFVATGRLAHGRIGHTATLLPDGRVLVIGGYDDSTAETWDARTGEWSPAGSMAGLRDGHQARLLDDGRVIVFGGYRATEDGDANEPPPEVWDPLTGTFGPSGPLASGLTADGRGIADTAVVPDPDGVVRTRLADGRVLVTGGRAKEDPSCTVICRTKLLGDAAIRDPVTGKTTELPPMTVARADHTGTLLPDGRVLLVGSHTHGPEDATAELFQPRP